MNRTAIAKELVKVAKALTAMSRSDAASVLKKHSKSKIKDVYDDNPDVQEALGVLMPGFEYPDWSGKTVGEFLKKRWGTELVKVAKIMTSSGNLKIEKDAEEVSDVVNFVKSELVTIRDHVESILAGFRKDNIRDEFAEKMLTLIKNSSLTAENHLDTL